VSPATAALFDALGDPTRRAMVSLIAQGPISVSALSTPLEITVTAVGQHLRVLEQAGLAASEKRGRTRFCQLRPDGLQKLEQWARDCRAEWEARLDRLGTVLDDLGSEANCRRD
jgi:DNA-binding transcriptional ArsR family regulator